MPKDNEDNPEFDLADLIRDLGHGATNRLGSAKLADVLNACRLTGKKGRVTIDIAVAAGPDGIAEIRAAIKTTRPEAQLPGGAYYVTSEGALVTEDPRQTKLPLPRSIPMNPVIPMNPKGDKAS